jgi:hypothetical protein
MQGVSAPLQKVTLWTEISAEELAALQGALLLPVKEEECPPPAAPAQPWKLTPSAVVEAKRARANQRWKRRAVIIALLVYLLAVGLLVSRMVVTSRNVDKLRKWQSEHEQALSLVQNGRAAWKELGPVVDTKSYPLELLLQASQSIPADQLHLTLFETGNGKLLIKGEAKNVAGAFLFSNKLKSDPYFSGFNLTMDNPRPLPNDLAQFQIEGTRANK